MRRREVTIVNKLGLHARAAAKLVALAGQFESRVCLVREGRQVEAGSIMAVMMLAAGRGCTLEIQAEGEDEEEAVERIARLVLDRFGEPE